MKKALLTAFIAVLSCTGLHGETWGPFHGLAEKSDCIVQVQILRRNGKFVSSRIVKVYWEKEGFKRPSDLLNHRGWELKDFNAKTDEVVTEFSFWNRGGLLWRPRPEKGVIQFPGKTARDGVGEEISCSAAEFDDILEQVGKLKREGKDLKKNLVLDVFGKKSASMPDDNANQGWVKDKQHLVDNARLKKLLTDPVSSPDRMLSRPEYDEVFFSENVDVMIHHCRVPYLAYLHKHNEKMLPVRCTMRLSNKAEYVLEFRYYPDGTLALAEEYYPGKKWHGARIYRYENGSLAEEYRIEGEGNPEEKCNCTGRSKWIFEYRPLMVSVTKIREGILYSGEIYAFDKEGRLGVATMVSHSLGRTTVQRQGEEAFCMRMVHSMRTEYFGYKDMVLVKKAREFNNPLESEEPGIIEYSHDEKGRLTKVEIPAKKEFYKQHAKYEYPDDATVVCSGRFPVSDGCSEFKTTYKYNGEGYLTSAKTFSSNPHSPFEDSRKPHLTIEYSIEYIANPIYDKTKPVTKERVPNPWLTAVNCPVDK